MKSLRVLPFVIVVLLISVFILPVAAADCPDVVKTALDTTGNVCSTTQRNQACYGNVNLSAVPVDSAASFNFTKPGDLVDIAGVKQLILSPLDAKADTWGVALLKVQANLPDTVPGQNVSFILFGDVQIDNAVAATAATLSVSAKQTVNVRQQPSKTGAVVAPLKAGVELMADGITEDGAWLRVHAPDNTVQGWISASVVTISGDVKTLAVVKADAPRYSPMQAFYFKSGLKDAPCSQAPDSGILIQTPQGAGKIALNINGADITLGSTAYFQAQPSGEMAVSVVEGQGTVSSGGKTVVVPAGTRVRVPLDANLVANGAPSEAEPYDAASLGSLPLRLMPQTVSVAPALDAAAIAKLSLTPLPGKWQFATVSVNAGPGCPAGTAEAIRSAPFSKTNLTVPEGPFDMRNVIDSSGNKLPASAVVTNPTPNDYLITFNQDGSAITYDFNVVAPDKMDGTMTIDAAGCQLTFVVTMTHQG